ncbi:hypothetical protein PFICI_13246 [Pestalotiopsis fici W106-1]|uniref:Uncharacterized protein n=1 Tax=Pestalotiopsis fici (strain W106-1 / CGMCC3.15140) TaxID=1229662 RepID=W3WNS1_PESFW|nr:uncharacterized protein PFICI_13246 [Pestalotiopsis fici W106-1]ETS74762.1 hypothetical protein PFICI_13246 [Pestalotiopsis fici W106-1]
MPKTTVLELSVMASNISEGEERIIALLEKIAENNGNDDSDRLAQTANGLSTAAMTVSIVALVIALLQALLEYASSNENHREKCNVGAIGRAAMLPRGSKWSWRHWRRKYTYPVLNLSALRVLESLPGGDADIERLEKIFRDAAASPYSQSITKDDSRQPRRAFVWREWKVEKKHFKSFLVCYWPWVLYHLDTNGRGSLHVYRRELPPLQRLRWYWFSLFQTRNEKLHPRATWAQLLEAFNITELENLAADRRMDAENIASSVDVPTQKVSLQDLGILAFHLGMRTVDISVTDRTILAFGPRGSISTEDLPGFGKVVRFQSHGDFNLGFRSPTLRRDQSAQLFGQLCFASSAGDVEDNLWGRLSIFPREWEHKPVSSGRTPRLFTDYSDDLVLPTTFDNSEAEAWEKLKSLQTWRAEHEHYGIVWPTIFLAATAACLPGQTLGFPARLMLRPFHEFLRQWAEQVRDRCGLPMEPAQRRNLKVSEWLNLEQLQLQDLCIVDFGGSAAVNSVCELSSWAFWQIGIETLQEVEFQLCQERYTMDSIDTLNGFDNYFQQQYATSGDAQETYRILPEITSLFAEYDPDSWSAGLGDLRAGLGPKRPQNVLWTQVILLDLTIRKLLNSCPPGPDSSPKDPTNPQKDDLPHLWRINATRAVVGSWSDPNSEWPLQNLESFLVKAFNIDENDTENRYRMTKLSGLIQLRTLCFLAYLMVIPDSSSLYLARNQEMVVLPMI